MLQKQITEEVAYLSQQENPAPSQFVEDVLHQLLFEDSTFHKLMMNPFANFLCQMLFQQASKTQIEKVLDAIK